MRVFGGLRQLFGDLLLHARPDEMFHRFGGIVQVVGRKVEVFLQVGFPQTV